MEAIDEYCLKYRGMPHDQMAHLFEGFLSVAAFLMRDGSRVETLIGSFAPKLKLNGDFTDPEKVKGEDPFPGFEDGYFEEYISLLDLDLIKDNIHLKGGAELRVPIEYASEGTEIHFETTDLDGNPVRSEELFAGHPVTMINLWATWCGPCRMLAPVIAQIAVKYEGTVKVGKVDVDENPELAESFNVSSIPTLILFKDGKPVAQRTGGAPMPLIEAFIKDNI
jgi:thioredoxin 1